MLMLCVGLFAMRANGRDTIVAPRPEIVSSNLFCNGIRLGDEIVVVDTRMVCGSCDPESLRNGVRVENSGNTIVSNQILGSGAAGVRIHSSDASVAAANTIGGDTDASENAISGSGGNAIEGGHVAGFVGAIVTGHVCGREEHR